MALEYMSLYRKSNNISVVHLTSATELDKEVTERIAASVVAKTQGAVELDCRIDPSLGGGFIFRIDDKQLDASVRGALERIAKAFKQTSAEAGKIPELQSKINELTEQLTQSQNKIKTLTEQVNNARQLKESIANGEHKVQRLNEEVSKLTKKSEALEAKLEGQTKVYTEKLQERTNLAKTYKARFLETLNRYVESKASMLGVKPSEITSRLNESYTLADVDAVCDQILESTVNFGRLPFGGRSKASARISESISRPSRKEPEYGYDIDDSLLELAGLKK